MDLNSESDSDTEQPACARSATEADSQHDTYGPITSNVPTRLGRPAQGAEQPGTGHSRTEVVRRHWRASTHFGAARDASGRYLVVNLHPRANLRGL